MPWVPCRRYNFAVNDIQLYAVPDNMTTSARSVHSTLPATQPQIHARLSMIRTHQTDIAFFLSTAYVLLAPPPASQMLLNNFLFGQKKQFSLPPCTTPPLPLTPTHTHKKEDPHIKTLTHTHTHASVPNLDPHSLCATTASGQGSLKIKEAVIVNKLHRKKVVGKKVVGKWSVGGR